LIAFSLAQQVNTHPAMGHGLNGFRVFSFPKGKVPRQFKKCHCGYAGLPHVSTTPNVPCCTLYQMFRRVWGMTPEKARKAIRHLQEQAKAA
jgi:hypothetical protein